MNFKIKSILFLTIVSVSLCVLLNNAIDKVNVQSTKAEETEVFIGGNVFRVKSEIPLKTPTDIQNTVEILKLNEDEKNDIKKLINELKKTDYEIKKKIKSKLIAKAGESKVVRKYIIDELLNNLNSDDPRIIFSSQENYTIWESSIEILGDLRAEEGIDYFIRCIDCGIRYSQSLSGYPAFKAVVKMGNHAMPALSNTLTNVDREKRIFAVYALREIGGQQAVIILQSALAYESDEGVREVIEKSINQLK